MGYADFLRKLYPDSHNINGPVYSVVLGAIGTVKDQFDPVQVGLAQEFNVTTAYGVALDRCGLDWSVPRRAGEGDEDYRARILAMLLIYANGSTVQGMKRLIATLVGTEPQIIDCAAEGWCWTRSAWAEDRKTSCRERVSSPV